MSFEVRIPSSRGADRQRPWLVINNREHPFHEEQLIALAVSTKEYEDSLALTAERWETGGVPRTSFVSPWAIHSPRVEDLVAWQGRVRENFVREAVDMLDSYVH